MLLNSLVALLVTQVCIAENYPQFRGPEANAVSASPLPVSWSDVDGKQTNIRWKIPVQGEGWSPPIVWEGHLYMTAAVPSDRSNGDAARPESNNGGYGRNRKDLVDGKHLYAMDADGNTHVIAAGDELKVVAVNELEQQAWGTPALADGRIYLRTVDQLYCIATKQ